MYRYPSSDPPSAPARTAADGFQFTEDYLKATISVKLNFCICIPCLPPFFKVPECCIACDMVQVCVQETLHPHLSHAHTRHPLPSRRDTGARRPRPRRLELEPAAGHLPALLRRRDEAPLLLAECGHARWAPGRLLRPAQQDRTRRVLLRALSGWRSAYCS